MNKTENLKLKDIEELDESMLKMEPVSYYYGSGGGSEDGSGEGNPCTTDFDCAIGYLCGEKERKCIKDPRNFGEELRAVKMRACEGKRLYDTCSYENGNWVSEGTCMGGNQWTPDFKCYLSSKREACEEKNIIKNVLL